MIIALLITAIQIITESLPVSSSGHVLLLTSLFHVSIAQEWIDSIHLPSIIIAASWLVWYGSRRRISWQELIRSCVLIGWADVLTTMFYCVKKIYPIPFPLWAGFTITIIVLWSLRSVPAYHRHRSLAWFDATVLGVAQGFALLPGVSRFAMVFVTACWLRFAPLDALAITWLMALPLMSAAILKGIWQVSMMPSYYISPVSMIVVFLSTLIAAVAFTVSVMLINNKKLWWFAVYLLIPLAIALYYHI